MFDHVEMKVNKLATTTNSIFLCTCVLLTDDTQREIDRRENLK